MNPSCCIKYKIMRRENEKKTFQIDNCVENQALLNKCIKLLVIKFLCIYKVKTNTTEEKEL